MPSRLIMSSGQLQAVRYNGSFIHAHALQHWVDTGMYQEPAGYHADHTSFRLHLPDGSSPHVHPHMIIVALQQPTHSEYILMDLETFKHYHRGLTELRLPVGDYLNLYFNMQDRQSLYQPCYQVGTILHTANSRKHSNALITQIHKHTYRILTEIGTEIWLTLPQIESNYLKPISAYLALTQDIPAYRKQVLT